MRRRAFLRNALSGGVALFGADPAEPSGLTEYPFTLGVASGDPSPQGVVLWTRLAPHPLIGGGMPPLPVLVSWRVADDAAMQRVVKWGVAVAWPSLAHAVHVEVNGLEPGRWYYYQFRAGDAESPVGRTRTLPLLSANVEQFRFAFVSCQNWQAGLYGAYRNLAREDLELVVHLGDYIYEDAADPGAPRQHVGGEVSSLASYRNRYALYRTDPHLQAAQAAFPWLVIPDDHEVDNDYANITPEGGAPTLEFAVRRANAYQAYYEHMPLRSYSRPVGASMQVYRGITIGSLAQISALDTRQYRSDQPCNGSLDFPCGEMFNPLQTMTGPVQERWLLDRLNRSTARWNVIAQQTMFCKFDFLAGNLQLFNMDQWDGYLAARHRLTHFLEERRPSNPIVLTGDIHSSWVHDIKADFRDPNSSTLGVEFVGPSITSEFPAPLVNFVTAALADNPHTHFFDGLLHGYVKCTITPQLWHADYRVVPSILDDQVDAFTLASFAVLDGQPGVLTADT